MLNAHYHDQWHLISTPIMIFFCFSSPWCCCWSASFGIPRGYHADANDDAHDDDAYHDDDDDDDTDDDDDDDANDDNC